MNVTHEDSRSPSPLHWAVAILFPIFVAVHGLKKNSIDRSGAAAGLVVGFILAITCLHFVASLFSFFIFASKATKFRSDRKKKIEADYKEGGKRNWIQVICNCGPATVLAIFYMFEVGCVDVPLDYSTRYAATWYAVAVTSAFSSACGDTFASEIGSVVGAQDPVHILTFRRVPRGTNGGVSLGGTLSSILGGTIVGVSCYITVLLTSQHTVLAQSPPQWPIILFAAFAGFWGSLIDSVLGSTLQFSGMHKTLGCIVEHNGPNIERVSGIDLLDNHSVNFLASFLTGITVPYFAAQAWLWFV